MCTTYKGASLTLQTSFIQHFSIPISLLQYIFAYFGLLSLFLITISFKTCTVEKHSIPLLSCSIVDSINLSPIFHTATLTSHSHPASLLSLSTLQSKYCKGAVMLCGTLISPDAMPQNTTSCVPGTSLQTEDHVGSPAPWRLRQVSDFYLTQYTHTVPMSSSPNFKSDFSNCCWHPWTFTSPSIGFYIKPVSLSLPMKLSCFPCNRHPPTLKASNQTLQTANRQVWTTSPHGPSSMKHLLPRSQPPPSPTIFVKSFSFTSSSTKIHGSLLTILVDPRSVLAPSKPRILSTCPNISPAGKAFCQIKVAY